MRIAINFLQRCKTNTNFISTTKKSLENINEINIKLINEISGIIPSNIMNDFINSCIDLNIEKVDNYILNLYNNSYSLTIQLDHIIEIIAYHKTLSNKHKSLIIENIVSIDHNLLKGCDEYIQYTRLAYNIMNVVGNYETRLS